MSDQRLRTWAGLESVRQVTRPAPGPDDDHIKSGLQIRAQIAARPPQAGRSHQTVLLGGGNGQLTLIQTISGFYLDDGENAGALGDQVNFTRMGAGAMRDDLPALKAQIDR